MTEASTRPQERCAKCGLSIRVAYGVASSGFCKGRNEKHNPKLHPRSTPAIETSLRTTAPHLARVLRVGDAGKECDDGDSAVIDSARTGGKQHTQKKQGPELYTAQKICVGIQELNYYKNLRTLLHIPQGK